MFTRIKSILIICVVFTALGGALQTAAADTEANKVVVERRVELWNTGDLAIADEIFATDFVSHVPHYPNVTNLGSYIAEVASTRATAPDFHAEVHDLIAEGDKVVCRFTNRYTAPTGGQVTATGVTVDRFVDGKIVEEWWSVDVQGVMEQFGMIPPMREDYAWGEPSGVTGAPGDPETNKASVQRMLDEVMNQQNLAVVGELFAPGYLMHDPAVPMEVRGPEGFAQWASMMLEPFFSDSRISAELVAEGDKVVAHWTWTGTHTGEFMGIPPTGRQIAIAGISIHRFADGQFVESWASYDSLGMMQQLTAEEWSADGVWIASVPTPMGNMIVKCTWTARDTEKTQLVGEFEQISTYPVLIDIYPDSEEVEFAGGLAAKIELNKYEVTFIQYFTKTTGPSLEEIVGIGIITGTFDLVGPDLATGQGTGAYYLAEQDADQDGFPDEGQEPVVCVPWEWTARRLTIMPGCVPTPIPEQTSRDFR
jgi:steroid delta-isomerase-like uncharacterized protein